eukprot:gene16909-20108_t
MGRDWYEMGKRMKKMNTFHDFSDCIEHLFSEKYTSPSNLVGHGSSAGGLLVGYMAMKYPQYFAGIVAKVPFVDMMTAMLDDTLPLTIHEYGEWGNPSTNIQEFDYISSYDPYRLTPTLLSSAICQQSDTSIQRLPSILLTGSLEDVRVPYWQPLKWMAKLRESIHRYKEQVKSNNTATVTKDSMVLLKIDDHGHFGSKVRDDYLDSLSYELAFMIKSVELANSTNNNNNNNNKVK